MTFRVGATLAQDDISYWEPQLSVNNWMRIFPNSNGLPPPWTDSRYAYCYRVHADPFISSKIDGDATKLNTLRQFIIDMPTWVNTLWVTDRHEPEGDVSPASYKANFTAFWSMIQGLPAAIRAKVKAGPVLTRQWTENTAGRSYADHDPGIGDFLGIDMYMNSWGSPSTTVATSFPDPVTFLSKVKAYRYSPTDTRMRVFPELGAIGIPADTDGTARAAWMQGLVDELNTWSVPAQGWLFGGFIWWNNTGKQGDPLTGIGPYRYFQLDRRHTGDDGSYAILPGTPAAPLAKYNAIASGQNPTPPPPREPGEDDPPPPVDGGSGATPVPPASVQTPVGPMAARWLASEFTILVTDKFCNVLGDPIHEWQTIQATLRWKEPGSGQVTVPAYQYIRSQLLPGCRIVILRRVLGMQHILISGPMESLLRERSDDGDKGGPGSLTITFAEDMAWLGARLAYPDPTKTPETQTTDYWVYSGDPETGMLQLVETQAGPSALVARRVPALTVAPNSHIPGTGRVAIVGTTAVAPRERLEKLTDVLRKMASLGAGAGYHPDSLGFRTRQVGSQILFEVVRSQDLAGQCHFSFGMGNLKYYGFELVAPKSTDVIVGGQGEGADRFIKEFPSTDANQLAWGRFETYAGRPGTTAAAEMADVAKQELTGNGQTGRLAVSAADTVDQRYGLNYNVGDIVSVELDVGEFEVAPVQTVSLQAWPTAGEVVGVTIGDQSARYDSAWIRKQRDYDRRLGLLERRAVTTV